MMVGIAEEKSNGGSPSGMEMERERERDSFSKLKLQFQNKYLFAILPIFIIIIYYIVPDTHSLFSSSSFNTNLYSHPEQARESQLRALYLLRQQQLGLLHAATIPISQTHNLKSLLSHQISLNSQIQSLLVSPYGSQVGNATCPTITLDHKLSNKNQIQWNPKPNKYLVAICVSGKMSDHLICLEKHMLLAALLNRVLVIPSSKFDYEYERVLDIEHINKCVASKVKVVISFQEFSSIKKHGMHVDKLMCYFSEPKACYLDEQHLKKLKSLGLSMGKAEAVWEEDGTKPKKRSVEEFVSRFNKDDSVIAIGDVLHAELGIEMMRPFPHNCNTLVQPSRLIFLTAQRFIQTFLGRNFIALHFRRHAFLNFCNAKKPSCFYPIPQAAECILRVLQRANAPIIYLSTDAAESEIRQLQSLLVLDGRPVPLVKRPPRNSAEKWDALLYRHHIEGDPQVEAMLDKTICAMSTVFIGASGSTFTQDIRRLRRDWGSASLCDQYLCQGQEPNVVADTQSK